LQGIPGLRTTANQKSIYLHVIDWPASSLSLSGFEARILSARLLADGKPLAFRQNERKVEIDLPSRAPDPNVSVIALYTY